MEKKKINIGQIIVIAVFALIIFGGMILHLVLPDSEVSKTERRYLAEFPKITLDAVLDSKYSGEFDEYMTDHFPFRDFFRSLKAISGMAVGRSDNNGYVLDGNKIYKLETKTDEKQIAYAASHFDYLTQRYLDGYNIFYTIIPDKSYYNDLSYPKLDYELLKNTFDENNELASYIDITPYLNSDSYYDTDTHWRQESITAVADALVKGMGIEVQPVEWTQQTLGTFPGVYKAHSGFDADDDTLVLMHSVHTDNAVVHNLEKGADEPMYQTDRLTGMDGYDVYLGGASALLVIENDKALTERELVIFRDSFGSSLVPLLTPYYAKISVIDLRYVSSEILGDYVEFDGEGDVLFAFSTILLNSGRVLR
nr:hypothetical protein [Clostridia bacterium]